MKTITEKSPLDYNDNILKEFWNLSKNVDSTMSITDQVKKLEIFIKDNRMDSDFNRVCDIMRQSKTVEDFTRKIHKFA